MQIYILELVIEFEGPAPCRAGNLDNFEFKVYSSIAKSFAQLRPYHFIVRSSATAARADIRSLWAPAPKFSRSRDRSANSPSCPIIP